MKKSVFSVLFFLFFSCENYHEKSFNQLNNAFQEWYVKSSKNEIFINDDSDTYFFYYNQITVNDILEDLKRFKLELSQINYNKISDENKNLYKLLDNKIKHIIFEYYHLRRYENDPSLYIKDIMCNLENVHDLNNYSNYDKLLLINDILNEAKSFLDESKFILKNYINLDKCKIEKDILLSYLSYLLIEINDISYENEIQSNRILFDTNIMIQSYIDWVELNLTFNESFNRLDLYDSYFDTYISTQNNYNYFINKLNQDIDMHYKKLFDSSLSLYLAENDEPVWVDNDDSLQVIKWAINDSQSKYQSSKYIEYSNTVFDTLNASYIDSTLYKIENDFIYDGKESNSQYETDNLFINYNLYNFFDNKLINNEFSIYLNKYYYNAFLINLNEHINKFFINQKDMNFEVLFYLNLYKRFKQIHYQERYLQGDTTLKAIKDYINNDPIFSDLDKVNLLDKLNIDYYLLYEYILYSKLNKAFINDKNLYNQKSLMKLINENLYTN